tara:strand:- start:7049 stop:8122 length:1074 start_codon:yes stop_codon:yes gene_type:complete
MGQSNDHISSETNASPKVRAFFLSVFEEAAERNGLNTQKLLRETGIPPSTLASPYSWVPLPRYIDFMIRVGDALDNQSLGAELGSAFSISDLGPFYTLVTTARTVGMMLEAFIRFQRHWQTDTNLSIKVEEDRAEICYNIADPALWPRHHDTEFTLCALIAAMRQTVGTNWRPVEVRLEHDIAGREARLTEIFRAPVLGDQDHNAIVIPTSSLDMPLAMNTRPDFERLQPIIERHLVDLMGEDASDPLDVVEQTRRLITEGFGRGTIHLRAIAAELGKPERTLRRQLAQQGHSFRDLLQDQRMLRARQLLESRANIPLEKLAETLGYADAASFARAFKAWNGVSPRRFARVRRAGQQ